MTVTTPQHIWVDADACPKAIRDMLYRAAERKRISVTFVANQWIQTPRSPFIHFIQVKQGFDVADNEIVQRVNAGDLVVTQDIPLAAEAIDKGAIALHPRGELFTKSTIQARLTMRNFMETMRSAGVDTGGPKAMSQSDRQQFANQLDKLLS